MADGGGGGGGGAHDELREHLEIHLASAVRPGPKGRHDLLQEHGLELQPAARPNTNQPQVLHTSKGKVTDKTCLMLGGPAAKCQLTAAAGVYP